jgi:hypothetical protein
MNTFKDPGVWWDPTRPDERWHGTLAFDPSEGPSLTIVDPTRTGGFGDRLRHYDTIVGETTAGRDVTLLRCFDRSLGGTLGKPGRREVLAHAALVGFHAVGPDPSVIGLSARLRHVNRWWNRSGILVDQIDRFPNATVRYERTAALRVGAYNGVEVRIHPRLRSLALGADETGRFELQEDVWLDIESDAPRPLSDLQERLHECQDLLSIACGQYCSVDELQVYQELKPFPVEATFYAVPVVKPGGSLRNRTALFAFDDIDTDTTFTTWMTHAAILTPIRALYFLAIYGDNFAEGRFLALVQAAEGFHRRLRGGEYMVSEEYVSKVAVPLVAAIPPGIDNSLRDALRSRIRFGHEYSLRKRVGQLFAEHQLALGRVLPDAMRLINPIVNRRNALTHLLAEEGAAEFEGASWLPYNFILRTLLDFCFLKAAGFSDTQVAELAGRCSDYAVEAQWHFARRSSQAEA